MDSNHRSQSRILMPYLLAMPQHYYTISIYCAADFVNVLHIINLARDTGFEPILQHSKCWVLTIIPIPYKKLCGFFFKCFHLLSNNVSCSKHLSMVHYRLQAIKNRNIKYGGISRIRTELILLRDRQTTTPSSPISHYRSSSKDFYRTR